MATTATTTGPMRLLGACFLLLLVVTPTCCNAARVLRDSGRSETRSLSEEKQEFEKRSSSWSDKESGDDAVPTSSATILADTAKYNRWLQEEVVTRDYADTPAAANPSIPCC